MITNNALDLLKKRYFKENENTWEDLCKRVSTGIANAEEENKEKWQKIFYNMMVNFEFIPSTPCLINADESNKGQLSSCISGDTEVFTRNGIKLMKDIKVGDEVLTHKNRFRKVIAIKNNGVKDTIAMSYSNHNRKRHTLLCTPDHKILSKDNKWVDAEKLIEHKKVSIWESNIHPPKTFTLFNDNHGLTKDFVIENNIIIALNTDERQRCGRIFKSFNQCYNIINNNLSLAYLFGYYLANGSIARNTLQFTINSTKLNELKEIKEKMYEVFGVQVNEYKSNHGNWFKVSIENVFIKNLFSDICGFHAESKKIPEWITNSSKEYKLELLRGIYADAIKNKNNVRLILANPTLTYQTTLIERSLGKEMVYIPNYMNILSKKPTSYTANILNNNKLKINKIKSKKEIVYDIQVEEDNSFVAGDFYVHNCFIIDVKDTIESIYQAKSECAKIFQKNGGVGFNISSLRPKGAAVETSNGRSCGTIGFMEEFDLTADVVTRNNIRKGAIKIDLNDWHPDILEFIHCKDDTNKFTHMNISVSLSDRFMEAVKNNKDWELVFPDYSFNKEIYNNEWDGNLINWVNKGYPVKVYKKIKARKLYSEIMESAWKTGEPGVSFRDTMDKFNPNPHLGKVTGSNPCLHKDTYMVTENGLEKISKLKSKIWNGKEFSETKTWKTGVKKVIKIMTNSGFEYITTLDHKFLLENGHWCEAQNLIGKKIKFEIQEKKWKGINPYPKANYEVLGFEFGDGSYHKASARMKYIFANPEKDKEVIELIESVLKEKFEPKDVEKQNVEHIIKIPYGTIYADAFYDKIENRMIPDWIMKLPKEEMKKFLRGLFSANGTNLKKYNKIQLVSINTDMLKQVQQMLLMFGIKGKLWYHSKKKNIEFSNGEYTCKQSSHIVLSRDSYKKYLDNIGFIQEYKNGYNEFKNKNDEKYETVILIQELDDAEVWDFTESNLHMGITNGAYVHNCQEFTSIPYNSCNLGSINLTTCVENNQFNFNKFKIIIQNSIRFIDNMITVNKLPFEKITNTTKSIRSVGLGIMGLADCLYMLKIPYNKPSGYKFIDELFLFMKTVATNTSIELAKEKGVYPAWEGSKWEEQGIEIRNSNLLSIAPTGSISFIANTSGGLEPNFALTYSRRTNEGDLYYITNSIFEKELKNRGLYSQELLQKIIDNKGSCIGIEEIPKDMQEIFIIASDITPMQHTEVVGIIQKHVDLSTSKTVNLPNSATIKDIEDIYMYAWEIGCKGITVYRDGCREDQTLSVTRKKSKNNYITPKKAMIRSKGERVKLPTGCGSIWLMTFKDKNGNLAEIFSQPGTAGGCQGLTEALTRTVSLLFRSGVDPKYIVDQLQSVKCPVAMNAKKEGRCDGKSCSDIIAKELLYQLGKTKNDSIQQNDDNERSECLHIENDSFNRCPECGEKLRSESGCQTCVCGWSRCS